MSKLVPVNPAAKTAETLWYIYTGPKGEQVPLCYPGTNTPMELPLDVARDVRDGRVPMPTAPRKPRPGTVIKDEGDE